jgi:putative SOS response-associated peptidase YedK
MKDIHDRMPAILLPEQEKIWLDTTLSAQEVMKIIEPYPSDLMKAYKVSPAVGNVRNNSKDLILPFDDNKDS